VFGESAGRRVTPNADGRFRIAGLRPGAYSLSAKGAKLAAKKPTLVGLGVAEQVTDVELLVAGAAAIRGITVGEAGKPVADIEVRGFGEGPGRGFETKSDATGACTIEGVQPGRYTAVVRKKPPAAKKPAKGKKAPPPPPAPSAPVSYEITASLAPAAPNAEREPDDDRGTANDLIVGDPVTGFVGWSNDADVWKLSIEALSAKNVLDIELGPVENVMFTLELADAGNREVGSARAIVPPGGVVAIEIPIAP
jgi:hypothetical protein